MVRALTWISICSLAACGNKVDDASSTDTGTGSSNAPDAPQDETQCDTTVQATEPEDNTPDHYYRDPIRFILSEPDPTAVVVTDVSGTTSRDADDRTIIFTPDEPLEPSTDYEFGLDYCYGDPEIEFSTSSLGTDIDPDVVLEGKVYSLDLTSGEYTLGERMGDLLNVVFTRRLLFSLEQIDGDSVDVLAAVANGSTLSSEQDLCSRTVSVDGLDLRESPYFTAEVLDKSFGSYQGELRFARFAVSGTIASDASTIGGLAFEATMAVNEMSEAIDSLGTTDDICEYAANLGVPCQDCPDDGFEPCISVAAEHIVAVAVDLDLVEVTEAGAAEGCDRR